MNRPTSSLVDTSLPVDAPLFTHKRLAEGHARALALKKTPAVQPIADRWKLPPKTTIWSHIGGKLLECAFRNADLTVVHEQPLSLPST